MADFDAVHKRLAPGRRPAANIKKTHLETKGEFFRPGIPVRRLPDSLEGIRQGRLTTSVGPYAALFTRPSLMHFVQTLILLAVPSTSTRTRLRFGLNRRFFLLLA